MKQFNNHCQHIFTPDDCVNGQIDVLRETLCYIPYFHERFKKYDQFFLVILAQMSGSGNIKINVLYTAAFMAIQ